MDGLGRLSRWECLDLETQLILNIFPKVPQLAILTGFESNLWYLLTSSSPKAPPGTDVIGRVGS